MEIRTIRITESDVKKLREAIREASQGEYRHSIYIEQLKGELDRAEVIPARQMPADVITMNSRVALTDLSNKESLTLTLVYPEELGKDETCVSILAPIGTAMLGYREGDVFEWDTPGGRVSLRVEKILYQPEAAGNFD